MLLLVETMGRTGEGGEALWGEASRGTAVMRGVVGICLEGDNCTSCGFEVCGDWTGHSGFASTGETKGFDWTRSRGGDRVAAFDWPLVVHWADAEDSAILSSCLVASNEPPGEEELRGKVMVGGVRWDLLGVGTVMATVEACADPL